VEKLILDQKLKAGISQSCYGVSLSFHTPYVPIFISHYITRIRFPLLHNPWVLHNKPVKSPITPAFEIFSWPFIRMQYISLAHTHSGVKISLLKQESWDSR